MPVIKTQNLTKEFKVFEKQPGLGGAFRNLFNRKAKKVLAVDSINLEIQEGEIVGFLGPNGAGKTTTLKMLSGLVFPTRGTAEVLGYTPWKRPIEFRKAFSLVMGQKNQLWWDLPASDSFFLLREIYGIDRKKFASTVDELTTLFQCRDLLAQPVRELSLGERMKMELTAALLHEPKLLLLDEPTIGLDVVAQSSIHKFLEEYNRSRKITILMTSHYMRDVERLCSRVVIISSGKMVYDGTLDGIKKRHGNEKTIRVLFRKQVSPGILPGLQASEVRGEELQWHVSREEIPKFISHLAGRDDVVDISIEDPPIEEVISKFFQSQVIQAPTLPAQVES
ncbi:MAG: ATP-binding cassette domain-containing protein [Gemmataceae bacterium]|nr:ATP-binding cassette domain-containing protein [Gemmataceae bacterium]